MTLLSSLDNCNTIFVSKFTQICIRDRSHIHLNTHEKTSEQLSGCYLTEVLNVLKVWVLCCFYVVVVVVIINMNGFTHKVASLFSCIHFHKFFCLFLNIVHIRVIYVCSFFLICNSEVYRIFRWLSQCFTKTIISTSV